MRGPTSDAECASCTLLLRHLSTFGHDGSNSVTTDGNSCHCAAERRRAQANISAEWEKLLFAPGGGEEGRVRREGDDGVSISKREEMCTLVSMSSPAARWEIA